MRYTGCAEALQALAAGLDEETCHDFRAIRQVVTCRAWEDVRTGGGSFHDAIEDGWSAARSACAAHGGTTPEGGFVRPEATVPQVTGAFEVRDRYGHPAGVVVAFSDGTAESCGGATCTDYPTVADALAALGGSALL